MIKKYYIVEGDHPVFARVYKHTQDKKEVLSLLSDMIELDYENIKITGKEEIIDG